MRANLPGSTGERESRKRWRWGWWWWLWWRLGGGKTNSALVDTSTGTVRAAGNRDVAYVEEREGVDGEDVGEVRVRRWFGVEKKNSDVTPAP